MDLKWTSFDIFLKMYIFWQFSWFDLVSDLAHTFCLLNTFFPGCFTCRLRRWGPMKANVCYRLFYNADLIFGKVFLTWPCSIRRNFSWRRLWVFLGSEHFIFSGIKSLRRLRVNIDHIRSRMKKMATVAKLAESLSGN